MKKQLTPLQFAFLFLVSAIVCMAISLWQRSQDALYRDHALRADAEIIRVYTVGRAGTTTIYRFMTAKGKSFEGNFSGRGKPGNHIVVEYLPDDPTQNRVVLGTSRTVIFFSFGLFSLGLSILGFRAKDSGSSTANSEG